MTATESTLVFHLGQLGDTVVALPAFWAVRRHLASGRLTLLSDRHEGKGYVLAGDLLRGSGIFDGFESYPVYHSGAGRWLRALRMLALAKRLRGRFDTLVYLMRSDRTAAQVRRDRRFFGAAGIRNFIGMEGFEELPARSRPLVVLRHETDALVARLAIDGIAVPKPGEAKMDLGLGGTEEAEVRGWLEHVSEDRGREWIGVGPGSKMAAKRWPIERFEGAVQKLIDEFDVWPVIFGGAEDREVGESMLRSWRRGYNAAGALGLRASAKALERCALYLGNDTGTMHLAAAAGGRCVAVFSARDWPGRWYPYGPGHKVFRAGVECEGCGLQSCSTNACLKLIDVSQVTAACTDVLRVRFATPKAA
jgi:heptosyltransferase III